MQDTGSEPIYGDSHLVARVETTDHVLTEQELLERRLKEQQKQSEEDSKWLLEKETNLVSHHSYSFHANVYCIFIITFYFFQKKRLSISAMSDRSETCSPNPSLSHQNSLERNFSQSDKDRPIVVKKMDPTPTADLDRTHDRVYDCTTNVVKAVMSLSQGKIGKNIGHDQTSG